MVIRIISIFAKSQIKEKNHGVQEVQLFEVQL